VFFRDHIPNKENHHSEASIKAQQKNKNKKWKEMKRSKRYKFWFRVWFDPRV
jgi:hypothetical protein